MTREEKLAVQRAYCRGYSAGSRKIWPDHRPIRPPDEIIGPLVEAALRLRDAVDNQLALFDPEDELQDTLGIPMDDLTLALARCGEWIREVGEYQI